MTQSVQLLGISNAIVDVLAHVDNAFLDAIGAPLGSMTLIDEHQAHDIYSRMGPATEMSGGSVANTVAGFANLGGSTAYIGKVRDDQLGDIFNHDMNSLGVNIMLEPAKEGAPTARSHVLISEGGHKSHLSFFGHPVEAMSKTTFYFVIAVLVLVDVIQGRYQKKLMVEKEKRHETVA